MLFCDKCTCWRYDPIIECRSTLHTITQPFTLTKHTRVWLLCSHAHAHIRRAHSSNALFFLAETHQKSKKFCISHFRCRIFAVCLCATEWIHTTARRNILGQCVRSSFRFSPCATVRVRFLFESFVLSSSIYFHIVRCRRSFSFSFARLLDFFFSMSHILFHFSASSVWHTFSIFLLLHLLLLLLLHSPLRFGVLHWKTTERERKIEHEINTSNCV